MPTFRTLITQSVEPTRQGDITGIDESIFALSSALAPLFGGYIYKITPNFTYIIFAFILLTAFALFIWQNNRIQFTRR
jgi:MFS family permease